MTQRDVTVLLANLVVALVLALGLSAVFTTGQLYRQRVDALERQVAALKDTCPATKDALIQLQQHADRGELAAQWIERNVTARPAGGPIGRGGK